MTGYQNTTGALHPVLARYDCAGRLLGKTISETGGAFGISGNALEAGAGGAVVTTTVDSETVMARYTPEGDQVSTPGCPGPGGSRRSTWPRVSRC